MHTDLIDELLEGSDAMLLEPREVFDHCVIGIAERVNLRVAAYDSSKVIQALQDYHGMDEDGATEWFDFNIMNAWVGEGSPVFMYVYGEE